MTQNYSKLDVEDRSGFGEYLFLSNSFELIIV